MTAMPNTADAIYLAIERAHEEVPRQHLGASQIGKACARQLWYQFRWSETEQFSGRMLRLFRRGQDEEPNLVADLKAAGLTVFDHDPATGEQFRVSAHGGHFGGSMDGVAQGVPECSSPDKWHVLEFKTSGAKAFAKLQKEGVEKARPEHFAQMQIYMHLSGHDDTRMSRALYIAVCKNDDEIYVERVKHDASVAKQLLARAEEIIFSDAPPPRISNDPTWFECKFCPFHAACHEKAIAKVNCRTCAHVTPERDGEARWSCNLTGDDLSADAQRKGCANHVYNPHLITFAERGDGSSKENWQSYTLPNGDTFKNGTASKNVLGSVELRQLGADMVCALNNDEFFNAMRAQFAARVEPLPQSQSEFTDDEIPF